MPISIARDFALCEEDLYKIITYCNDEVSSLKVLQDENRKLQDDLKMKHSIIVRLAKEIGKLKREPKI